MNYIKLILISILFSSSLFGAEIKKKEMPTIVPTSWLKQHINDPRVVIVDVRSKIVFRHGHIQDAVNLPVMEKLFKDDFFMPDIEFLRKTFSKVGIDNNSLVVAYDDGEFIWASRLYWVLEALGHKNVGILEVGYPNWKNAKLPTQILVTKPHSKEFIPRVDSTKVATKLSTLLSIGKKTIIDGRKKNHYDGKESLSKRFGHIPTAENYRCTANFETDNVGHKIKDLKVLSSMYKDVPKDKEVIVYCDGGPEAALNYVIMQELGYKVSVYDGSWFEWGNDDNLPIDYHLNNHNHSHKHKK